MFLSRRKRGAKLSQVSSEVVGPPKNMIEEAGGFVCQFSGDLPSLFPGGCCLSERAVETIDHIF
jgi:hypothetical protein